MSIRILSKELQEKAIKDLNEEPKRITDDINYIKEWLLKQTYIKARTDDQWILTFLRGCKFSLERTKEKLDTYYTMRAVCPEYFKNRDPFCPKIQEVLKTGVMLPLKATGTADPRVYILRTGVADTSKITMQDMFKTNMMISEIVLNEDDQILIGGLTTFQDMAGISMSHMASATPSVLKKAMYCIQEAYPNRPQATHFYNIPSFFEAAYALFKPFLKEKQLKRTVVHTKANREEILKVIPKEILPAEYGGDAGPIQDLIDYWKKKVESYAEWFREDDLKYGTDESKRPGKPKTSESLFGLDGSFRKLDVD